MKLHNFMRLDATDTWPCQMIKQIKRAINRFLENAIDMRINLASTFLDETNSVEKKNIL